MTTMVKKKSVVYAHLATQIYIFINIGFKMIVSSSYSREK